MLSSSLKLFEGENVSNVKNALTYSVETILASEVPVSRLSVCDTQRFATFRLKLDQKSHTGEMMYMFDRAA